MTENSPFVQPTLDSATVVENGGEVRVLETPATVVDSTDMVVTGDDELSGAVRQSMLVQPDAAVALLKPTPEYAAKYALEYVIDGEFIRETHIDVPHAVASFNRLRRLGVFAKPVTL